MRSPFPKRLPFQPFFQTVRHARPRPDMTVRPPEDSPGSLSAIGNNEALRMEGFFAFCGLPGHSGTLPRGEGQHGSETSPLPDGGPGQTLLKVRHGIRLPCRSIPKPEYHGQLVRQDGLPPAGQQPPRNGQAAGQLPCFLPASSASRHLQHPIHFPPALKDRHLHG